MAGSDERKQGRSNSRRSKAECGCFVPRPERRMLTVCSVAVACRYQRDILSWRSMPEDSSRPPAWLRRREEKQRGRIGLILRTRCTQQAAVLRSVVHPSAHSSATASSTDSLTASSLAANRSPAVRNNHHRSAIVGLSIHPSLQAPLPPAPPRFPHPLDPLVIPPPASRRRKAVERCTSPSTSSPLRSPSHRTGPTLTSTCPSARAWTAGWAAV